jgi:hypothetical protein
MTLTIVQRESPVPIQVGLYAQIKLALKTNYNANYPINVQLIMKAISWSYVLINLAETPNRIVQHQ